MSAKDQSIDQRRAAHAWDRTSPEAFSSEEYDGFAKLASGAPALIMANGLMQTLAFYNEKAKKDKKHRQLLQGILSWVGPRVLKAHHFAAIMPALQSSSSDTYMIATEEALEIAKWIRQFAKARNADLPKTRDGG